MVNKKRIMISIVVIVICILCIFQYITYKSRSNENNQAFKNSVLKTSESFEYNFGNDNSESQKEYNYREAMSYTKASSELIITTSYMNKNNRIMASGILDNFYKFLLIDLNDEAIQKMHINISQCFKDIYERPDNIDSYYKLEEIMKEIQANAGKLY